MVHAYISNGLLSSSRKVRTNGLNFAKLSSSTWNKLVLKEWTCFFKYLFPVERLLILRQWTRLWSKPKTRWSFLFLNKAFVFILFKLKTSSLSFCVFWLIVWREFWKPAQGLKDSTKNREWEGGLGNLLSLENFVGAIQNPFPLKPSNRFCCARNCFY